MRSKAVRVSAEEATPEVLRGLASWLRAAARSRSEVRISASTAQLLADVTDEYANTDPAPELGPKT